MKKASKPKISLQFDTLFIMSDREPTGIEVKLQFIIKELDEIKAKLEQNYVTQESFTPVRNIVYGMVGLILTAVFTSLIYLVIQK